MSTINIKFDSYIRLCPSCNSDNTKRKKCTLCNGKHKDEIIYNKVWKSDARYVAFLGPRRGLKDWVMARKFLKNIFNSSLLSRYLCEK